MEIVKRMLAGRDPIAIELYQRHNGLAMPNMRLNRQEAGYLLEYMDEGTQRVAARGSAQVSVVTAAVRESEPVT